MTATRRRAPREIATRAGREASAGGDPRRRSLAGAARHLKRARAICLALPDATETEAWGSPTFRVRDRMFAMFMCDHHGDGRIALWCKAPPGAQAPLVEAEPERFFVPPYVGPSGWIGLHLEKNNDAEVAYFARAAWEAASARSLRRSRGAAGSASRRRR